MIIDGKAIAENIKEGLRAKIFESVDVPELFILQVGHNTVTEKFLAMKRSCARAIGMNTQLIRFPEGVNGIELVGEIEAIAKGRNRGIIVQLPLPERLNTEAILDAIPWTHDVDVLSAESFKRFERGVSPIFPPVIGAMREILLRESISLKNKKVVIIGKGKLVGRPAEVWATREGGDVSVVYKHTPDIRAYTIKADVILSGAGSPKLLTPSMIKDGVVILDAGTSEVGGELRGDADPECADNARIFTPVPGGIGPITVVKLFENIMTLVAL